MSEPRYLSPLLDGYSLGQAISDHSGVECYPAMRDDSEKRYIVKKISLPASQVQVEALLLTGVYRDAEAVGAYYKELAQGVCEEVRILEKLSGQRGFVPYQSFQVAEMEEGIGYEVHLLSRYRKTLDRFTRRSPMTHLGAVNLGIDLCAALAVSREAGWLYVDLKPENIYLFGDQEYRIGDLGFVAMDSLAYASLPDRYRSVYTAPEVADAYASLNATMDTYALGLVLYQIYNEGKLPFAPEERQAWLDRLASGESVAPPVCADPEMAEIICKACAYAPEDRWQTPAQMGHALISYMQRNGADNIPITPPEPEEPESVEEEATESAENEDNMENPSEESAVSEVEVEEASSAPEESNTAVEENSSDSVTDGESVEEISTDSIEIPDVVEETPENSSETASDSPAAGEEAPEADWIDLMDAFLAEEEDGTEAAPAEDEPSLRELMSGTDEDMTDVSPLTEEEVSAETAHILTAADELIEHEAPAPVGAPEPIAHSRGAARAAAARGRRRKNHRGGARGGSSRSGARDSPHTLHTPHSPGPRKEKGAVEEAAGCRDRPGSDRRHRLRHLVLVHQSVPANHRLHDRRRLRHPGDRHRVHRHGPEQAHRHLQGYLRQCHRGQAGGRHRDLLRFGPRLPVSHLPGARGLP